jgi:hypothetical protein
MTSPHTDNPFATFDPPVTIPVLPETDVSYAVHVSSVGRLPRLRRSPRDVRVAVDESADRLPQAHGGGGQSTCATVAARRGTPPGR